ncbi:hypothetical protein GGI15_002394 [Coemansia interrupta]|uniref:FAM86 N-terminal domain-containing protein n=1 Tax=Coemansia interrupta TaxID=1126814 RepID=A0A9W8HKU5_9FUNG|nr:hypothetical protein GGI15_002394 [Coemansia interrupta]
MKTIVFHEHTISFSPSNRYIKMFLKKYIEKIESVRDYELDDELMELYVSLASTTSENMFAAGMCYKTYALDKEQYTRIVLREEQMLISQGTTGLQTWEASLRLADFFVEHPAMGASHVLATDFNGAVLKLLESNRNTNPEYKDKLRVAELDWENIEECARLSANVDVIVGTDITYDPTIVPVLVAALEAIVVSSQQVAYITATIRSQETFDLFLELIGKY